ncbi:MAG: replication-relaxation family protein [Planctomycetota bacterium]
MPLQLTHRDEQTLLALLKLPLTSQQLFRLSSTFSQSFPSERVTRRRLQRLTEEGMLRRFYFAFPSNGRNPAYWRLTRKSYHLLGEIMGELPSPKRSLFSTIGVSLHFHTHRVSEVVVKLLVDAHQAGIETEDVQIESAIGSVETEMIVPDATLTLQCEGRRFRFYIELDTASERIATLQRIPSSIQKKLELYERHRRSSRSQFRVLFVTTSSKRRAMNILRFGAGLTNNFSAQSIYAAFCDDLLQPGNAVTIKRFLNHRLELTNLVRTPRFCRLNLRLPVSDRIMAELNAKEFTPRWTSATVTQ